MSGGHLVMCYLYCVFFWVGVRWPQGLVGGGGQWMGVMQPVGVLRLSEVDVRWRRAGGIRVMLHGCCLFGTTAAASATRLCITSAANTIRYDPIRSGTIRLVE